MKILYEDNHVIVAVKPQNMPVQGDDSGDTDMLTELKAYIKEKYNKPGNVYLGLVHRLDRPVGGVMVFARTSKAAARLSECFAKKKARKKYVAVVCAKTAYAQKLECFMRKDEKTFSSYVCRENDAGAKFASLTYKRTALCDDLSLLDIDLKTGRHHQIRVQLADAHMPIYGDHRYNKVFVNDTETNIALFAYSLSFEHPTTHENMIFTHMPSAGVWTRFADVLQCMQYGASPVYLDENIIVCNKEKGVSCAIADGDENTLEHRLQAALPFAKAVHRLDATTDGLVMYARNERTYVLLREAFKNHEVGGIRKYYRCTVLGSMEKACDTLTAYLSKDSENGTVTVTDKASGASKQIVTKYKVLSKRTEQGYTLTDLEIELITGRTHQIRAHMAHISHPLVGDDKYGNRDVNKQLKERFPLLTSYKLAFDFPSTHTLNYLNSLSFSIC